MADRQLQIPWTQPGWFEQASAWISAQLECHGITVTGPIEQPHSYPWSTVLRVPTGEGNVFFKAVCPAHPHEPVLVESLARWSPDPAPRLLSVDTERGWILMRDAGRRLREMIHPTRDMRPWFPVLPRYAELQIELAQHVPDLLSLGVPDRRLPILPTLYEPLLTDIEVLRIGQTPGLTRGQYERLLDLAPRVSELCGCLAAYRIPETLNHGDLTDANVFVGEGSPVFIDWGDACVSHPFYSLRTVLVSAETSLGLEENSPQLHPLRDAGAVDALRIAQGPAGGPGPRQPPCEHKRRPDLAPPGVQVDRSPQGRVRRAGTGPLARVPRHRGTASRSGE